MPVVETRVGTLYYHDRGSGPVLVLLHAALHDHHDFDAIAPALQEQYRVIALDWPGCGLSPEPPDPAALSAPRLADALEDLHDHLGAPPVLLVGNSVGGFAAARLALTRPDHVTGLVLVGTGGFVPTTAMMRMMCTLMGMPAMLRLIAPALVRLDLAPRTALEHRIRNGALMRLRTTGGLAQGAALWRSFATTEHDLRSRASELTVPTLIVWGRHDGAIPLSAGRATSAALPHADFVVLEAGHVAFASAPERFLAVAHPFLHAASTQAMA